MARRQPTIKTLREHMSHLRKMISRLESMPNVIPPLDYAPVKIRRRGSQLIIDGQIFKPADLEKMIKSKSAPVWKMQALAELENKLGDTEYKYQKKMKKPGLKKTVLTDLEVRQAMTDLKRITDPEAFDFISWINSGSASWKKNLYYHQYGAETINKGDIRGFIEWLKFAQHSVPYADSAYEELKDLGMIQDEQD